MKPKTLSVICGGVAALGIVATVYLGCLKPEKDYYVIPVIPANLAAGLCGVFAGLAMRREEELEYRRKLDYQEN